MDRGYGPKQGKNFSGANPHHEGFTGILRRESITGEGADFKKEGEKDTLWEGEDLEKPTHISVGCGSLQALLVMILQRMGKKIGK